MSEFDFSDFFTKAFGYEPPKKDDSLKLDQAAGRKETSDLGQPYYATDLSGREFFLPVTINGYLIPFAVIGMTWKKTIVSTSMPERGGSVKELVSIDDYEFNIKGLMVNEDNNFPESDIIDLHNIFMINASVTMRSVLTDIVLKGLSNESKDDPDGHKVVIKDIKWPQVSGIEHVKPFEMVLESDMIVDLEID